MLLQAIFAHRRDHRISPTFGELSERLGVPVATIDGRLKVLCNLGLLSKVPRSYRSLALTPEGEDFVRELKLTRAA